MGKNPAVSRPNFLESIEIKLANETRDSIMTKMTRENFFLEYFLILNFNHGVVLTPSNGIGIVGVLHKINGYLHYFFDLLYERSFHLFVFLNVNIYNSLVRSSKF